MSQLQKIIYLTRQQYETLLSNNNTGQITYGGVTLTGVQDNNIYFITDETVSAADLGDDFILPVTKGGTGKTQFTSGSLLVGNGQNTLTEIGATNQNTANTIIKRDGSGNFSAGTITASLSGNATSANYPYGFISRSASASWGNTTGTCVTSWNGGSGSEIAFFKDNPASGQLSIKLDGTVYIKEGGQNISEAVKSFSVSGQTITYTTLWGNTGTFTTQDTTYANGTGITIGTGNAINHSNSVTAQTTQAVYPIKIDAQGHISAYGSAQTILSIGTGANDAAAGNHTHKYAGSSSVGGAATNATTTADTTNSLYLVGVVSGATTTLKHDTSITVKGGEMSATTYKVDSHVTLQYNSTDSALEFVFA